MDEDEEFISFVSSHGGEYVEYEQIVPKALFFLSKADQIAKVRKGLAREIRKKVNSRARQWSSKAIPEAIPDYDNF